ncbi:hypothetical protein L1987_77342 [Smallanthus sonchifolius]|uniref:Uncharacterized protein n=1 Tax=Smallanthus sonchifolius TaxID=185202 RepID=A0ACB8Z9X0_9ASTR|nr:hypothetical protein L1987_77342 [Smallanthus sonchifolius]
MYTTSIIRARLRIGASKSIETSLGLFERERGQSATTVDAYIKTYGVSEKGAIGELKNMIEKCMEGYKRGVSQAERSLNRFACPDS